MTVENSQEATQIIPTAQQYRQLRHMWHVSIKEATDLLHTFCRLEVESRGGTYEPLQVEAVAKWICTNRRSGLLLNGAVGSGKTTIARAICYGLNHMRFATQKQEVNGITYHGYCSALPLQPQETGVIKEYSATELCRMAAARSDEYEDVMKRSMLFIDDIGVEPVSVRNYGNELSPIAEMIDYRNDKRLLTIATTNLVRGGAGDEFRERYGDRTDSRMAEFFDVVTINGKDHRRAR